MALQELGRVRAARRTPRRTAHRREAALLVEGHVPHRRRLLLHPRLPARHRVPRRGTAEPHRNGDPGALDLVRSAACLPESGGREPPRTGVDCHARAAAAVLAGPSFLASAFWVLPCP